MQVSKVAAKLYRILVERPDSYKAEELQAELGGISKSRLLKALAELEEENIIHVSERADNE